MGDNWDWQNPQNPQDPQNPGDPRYDAGHPANGGYPNNTGNPGNPGNQGNPENPNAAPNDMDKRIEDIRKAVVQGANEAQQRFRRVFGKASEYLQQGQEPMTPRYATTAEEQRIRQLANTWSNENWRVAKDLGTYMDILSSSINEVWEVSVQTRWETRAMESTTEPYAGRTPGSKLQPIMPVWDYDLPEVTSLKAPPTRTALEGLDEVVGCMNCNGTGRVACASCNGRGWIVCPDCKGRTKKRCTTCRGRGYIADWTTTEKKSFFQKQAENVASSVGERVSDVFDNIRQQGVPLPNPIDTDPATKGPTVPCPDCVNGEVDCTCGNGKRICAVCEGAKVTLCSNCNGTGKVVRHREITRRFDLSTGTRIVGESMIPQPLLLNAGGEVVYTAEVDDTFVPEVAPQNVPMDVWHTAVELVKAESQREPKATTRPLNGNAQTASHATLQVIELVRIPYTQVHYRYSGQDYVFCAYDEDGREKFYADRYPARWNRIERLVQAISNDLAAPDDQGVQDPSGTPPTTGNSYSGGYRIPIEYPPYNISEEDDANGGNPM